MNVRYDRHGRATPMRSSTPETIRALAILQVAIDRAAAEERAAVKARQDSGQLTPQEKMMIGIFGEVK